MSRVIRSRRAGLSRDQSRQQPLYARLLGLQYLTPSGFLCFMFLEGALALGALLALAELVSWWGVLVLPVTVAAMVKLNDVVAGAVSRPTAPAVRGSLGRPAGNPGVDAWHAPGAVPGTDGLGAARTDGVLAPEAGLLAAGGPPDFGDFDGAVPSYLLPATSSPVDRAAAGAATPDVPTPAASTVEPQLSEMGLTGVGTSGTRTPDIAKAERRPLESWMPQAWMRESRPPDNRATDPWTPDLRTPDLRTPDLRIPDVRASDPWLAGPAAPEVARPEVATPESEAAEPAAPEPWTPESWTPRTWTPERWTPEGWAPDPQHSATRTRPSTPIPNAPDASALNGPPATRQWASRVEQLDDPQQLARQAASRRYE